MNIDEIPICSGIYRIEHTLSGRSYIGSAVNLSRRAARHIADLTSGKHHNPKLQRAWYKYGPDAFSLAILELCEPEVLILREQHWIDSEKPAFNICKIAGSVLGIKRSPETIDLQRKVQQRAAKENRSAKAACARNASAVHKEKLISDQEYADRIRSIRAKTGRARAQKIVFDGEARTISEWARLLGIHRSTLVTRLKHWGVERAITEASNMGKSVNRIEVSYRGELMSTAELARRLGVNRASFIEYADRNGFDAAVAHYEEKLRV